MTSETILDDLEDMVARREAGAYFPRRQVDFERETLIFFGDVPGDLLGAREEFLAEGEGAPEWFLLADRRIGTEQAKDFRELGVIVVPVTDLGAVMERLATTRMNASRVHDRHLRSLSELRATFTKATKAGGPVAPAWVITGPLADEPAVVNRCWDVENAAP